MEPSSLSLGHLLLASRFLPLVPQFNVLCVEKPCSLGLKSRRFQDQERFRSYFGFDLMPQLSLWRSEQRRIAHTSFGMSFLLSCFSLGSVSWLRNPIFSHLLTGNLWILPVAQVAFPLSPSFYHSGVPRRTQAVAAAWICVGLTRSSLLFLLPCAVINIASLFATTY